MAGLLRAPGQSPMLPGAVRTGDLIVTSGIVAPRVMQALGAGAAPDLDFRAEADDALAALLTAISALGGSAAGVMKLEAFLADPGDFAAWNEAFLSVWPEPGPARITLVSAFAVPGVRIEVQAIAAVQPGGYTA